MTITHVATNFSTPTAALTDTATVTKPSGLAVGDVMIAVVNSNQAGITSPGAHWTRIIQKDATSANPYRCEVWYCVATSTETAASNFVWSNGDTAPPMWVAIMAYRGVNQSSPINASNSNVATTTNPQTGPSITTTATSLVLNIRTVRHSSGSTAFSSSVTNERFDGKNVGTGSVSYQGAGYDSGSTQAAGSISGVSITAASGSNQTDTISITLALAVGDVNATPTAGAATAAALNAQALTGQSVTAGVATATAAAKQPTALGGKVALPTTATATAAVNDVGRVVRPTAGTVTVSAKGPHLFYGTPSSRSKVVPEDTWNGRVGIPQRRITVEDE